VAALCQSGFSIGVPDAGGSFPELYIVEPRLSVEGWFDRDTPMPVGVLVQLRMGVDVPLGDSIAMSDKVYRGNCPPEGEDTRQPSPWGVWTHSGPGGPKQLPVSPSGGIPISGGVLERGLETLSLELGAMLRSFFGDSQNETFPSTDAETRPRLPTVQQISLTCDSWAWKTQRSTGWSKLLTSQTRMLQSEDPDARSPPSAENRTTQTACVWPRK